MHRIGNLRPHHRATAPAAEPNAPAAESNEMTEPAGNASRRLVRRYTQLIIGLVGYGVGLGLMVNARLGLAPWDVFHQGVARHTGFSLGWVLIAVGALVLLVWIPLRQVPGVGTVANAIVIGLVVDRTTEWLPVPDALAVRIGYLMVGVLIGGVATGLYLGARLGAGPRDGLMTGLVARFAGHRWANVRLVRTAIELAVLGTGWLLGGSVGAGTLLYALAIGPLAQVFIPLLSTPARNRPVARVPEPAVAG
jgi:uncharacterized membrane protein YczE